MVVPCCNPHDTYLSSMFLYSVLLSSIQIFLFQSSLLYPTCHVSSPWQITLAHPDVLCMACPVLVQLASSFFSEASLPYPIFSISFWILSLPKFTLPWSACPSWPVSNLSYCTVWLEPTLYFPVCTTVTESKLSLLATQQANKSKRQGVKARNPTLFGEPTDQEDGRLMSLNNHLVEAWMPGSFMDQRWGAVRKRNKKTT